MDESVIIRQWLQADPPHPTLRFNSGWMNVVLYEYSTGDTEDAPVASKIAGSNNSRALLTKTLVDSLVESAQGITSFASWVGVERPVCYHKRRGLGAILERILTGVKSP